MSFRICFTRRRDPLLCDGRMHLDDAAAARDLVVEHPCGGRGQCTRCRVRFLEGAPAPSAADVALLSEVEREAGWRLSCQVVLEHAATIEVPAARLATSKGFGPAELPPPRGEPLIEITEGADEQRLAVDTELGRVIAMLSPPARPLGLVADLGTTTLAAALVDLESGRVLDTASDLNPQVSAGPDVISRILRATSGPAHHQRLVAQLRDGLAVLARQLVERQGLDAVVIAAALCGNATMSHFVAGEEVRSLGEAPFDAEFTDARLLDTVELGLPLTAGAPVRLMPQIASHVGGDTVAAILATGLDQTPGLEALIDLGTNTEIVVAKGERILVAAAAAGPAFEGAGISCGMRAAPGAIDRVSLSPDERLVVHTIDGDPALGICGTGIVDAAALLLDTGLLDPSGRLRDAIELPKGTADDLRQRLRGPTTADRSFVIAPRAGGGSEIAITARDLRELQLVKGSIAAGLDILLEMLGVKSSDLQALHVSGLFGSYLRKESLLRVGLVPPIDPERLHSVPDAAAGGVRQALCDRTAWQRCQHVARRTEHIALATHPNYGDTFAAALAFPPTAIRSQGKICG